ncbi:hypothetical protein GGF32_006825 [Allomyces javanicus]|nr:hypothetical protein GGF32_006825 [Allomyces javanicus]
MPRALHVAFAAALLLAVVAHAALAKSLSGDRVLAVLDAPADADKYSNLLDGLKERGFNVQVESVSSKSAQLFSYGERTADHLLLLTTKPLTNGIAPKSVIHFVNAGGNALIATTKGLSTSHRDLAGEFGIDFEDALLTDEFYGDRNATTVIASSRVVAPAAIIGAGKVAQVAYRGIAHTVVAADNPYLLPVLDANPTSVGSKRVAGEKVRLVSAMQAANNARVALVGSLDVLADEFMAADRRIHAATPQFGGASTDKLSNAAFATELLQWTFQEKAVVRAVAPVHHHVGGTEQHDMYRIKDEIVFNITLQEWTGTAWHAHLTNTLQFSATMLHPYVRHRMPLALTTAHSAVYSTHVHLPDVYGVYTFAATCKEPGYSHVEHKQLVSIRPYRHNEYPRYLPVAWPYYVGAYSHMAAFVVFAALWLSRTPVKAAVGEAAGKKEVETLAAEELLREEQEEKVVAAKGSSTAVAPAVAAAAKEGGRAPGSGKAKRRNRAG